MLPTRATIDTAPEANERMTSYAHREVEASVILAVWGWSMPGARVSVYDGMARS